MTQLSAKKPRSQLNEKPKPMQKRKPQRRARLNVLPKSRLSMRVVSLSRTLMMRVPRTKLREESACVAQNKTLT